MTSSVPLVAPTPCFESDGADRVGVGGRGWSPPGAEANGYSGPAEVGQFRIGPHTDFGTVTVHRLARAADRQA